MIRAAALPEFPRARPTRSAKVETLAQASTSSCSAQSGGVMSLHFLLFVLFR